MSLAGKIINTLLILVGPLLTTLTDYWGVVLPIGLSEAIISFLNLLLVLLGGAVTVAVGVPAAFRLFPKTFAKAFQQSVSK